MSENLTPAQKRALQEIADMGGHIGQGLGIRKSTVLALEKLGLVTFSQGRRSEKLAPGGWTGRVYVSDNWFAALTDEGRKAVDA